MTAYGQKVVAIVDTTSQFGSTLRALYQDVTTLKTSMNTLVADAPTTLDTLNEISAAIADDPAFFSTMSSANTTLQNNINTLTTNAAAARAALQVAIQAIIDANAVTSTDARTLLSNRLDSLELDPVTKTYVDTALANLLDSAPDALNTLNEIAAAIADDPTFFTTMATANAAIQADVDANEAAALTARNAIQADVDANEVTAAGLVTAENTAMLAAVAVVQADVDQNETDGDTALAAVQADVDQNEADADAAIAAVQADVDQNETDADAAIAAVQADVDQNESDADAAIATEKARIDAILDASDADKDSFAEIVTLINSVDTANDAAFAGYVASNDAAVALKANIDDPTFTTKIASPEFHSAGSHLKFKADTNDIMFYPNNIETLQITRHSGTGHPNFTANGGTGEFKFNQVVDLADGVKLSGTDVTATAAEINAFDGRLDTLEADPTTATALAAVQADVDANEAASDTAEAALSGRLDTLEADPTTATALAAVQADVNQNETDADTAIAAVQADVDANETAAAALVTAQNTAMLAAVAVVQADVDQNETDADTAIAAVQADVNQNETDADAAIAAVQADVDANETAAAALVTAENTAMLAAVAVVQADVNQNETDADAAIAAVQSDVDQNESDADTAIALKANKAGDTFTGDLLLRNPSGNAVSLKLSRADHADMSCEWKITPSYVSSSKECLSVLAAGQPVLHFDERQRVSINKTDPDYTLDVAGDGKFSTGLTVGGLTDAANDSAAASAGVAVNQLYRNGSIVMIRVS